MSVFANYNKTGFPECQPSTPPKLFLVRKIVTSDSGGSVASPSGNSTTWKDYEIQTDTYDPKTILPGGDPSYACRTWTLGFSSTDYSECQRCRRRGQLAGGFYRYLHFRYEWCHANQFL